MSFSLEAALKKLSNSTSEKDVSRYAFLAIESYVQDKILNPSHVPTSQDLPSYNYTIPNRILIEADKAQDVSKPLERTLKKYLEDASYKPKDLTNKIYDLTSEVFSNIIKNDNNLPKKLNSDQQKFVDEIKACFIGVASNKHDRNLDLLGLSKRVVNAINRENIVGKESVEVSNNSNGKQAFVNYINNFAGKFLFRISEEKSRWFNEPAPMVSPSLEDLLSKSPNRNKFEVNLLSAIKKFSDPADPRFKVEKYLQGQIKDYITLTIKNHIAAEYGFQRKSYSAPNDEAKIQNIFQDLFKGQGRSKKRAYNKAVGMDIIERFSDSQVQIISDSLSSSQNIHRA